MKRFFYTILTLVALLMTSCDELEPQERLIYVEPPEVSRAVLIEDFTGQYYVNCPRATEEIERLIEEYGDTTVIAVAIHSGPFSKTREPTRRYIRLKAMSIFPTGICQDSLWASWIGLPMNQSWCP